MRSALFSPLVLVSLLAAGCAEGGTDGPEEATSEARQAQIGIGFLDARRVRFTFADRSHTPFAELHVLNRPMGGRVPGTEYWYVNRAATSLLATTPIDIAVEDLTADPPDPDYPDEQSFTQIEFPTSGWGSGWTADPLSYGTLLGNGDGLHFRLATSRSGDVTRVAWYQVIPATQSPQYLTPSGHFVSSGDRVSVPSGYRGYDIDQTVP